MTDPRPPRDNIVRASFPGPELARDGDAMPVMRGHFAVYDQWTLISSVTEGTFMERIAPGAFAKTFSEGIPKVLFQHGKDPQVGDKPLGIPSRLEEDAAGGYYEVPLLDTSYNRDILPGLEAGAYGASFRFSVVKEDFEAKPARSASNPDAIPERTVREARVYEFGPVTFPAYEGASAAVRSMTDEYLFDRLTADPDRLRDLVDSALPDGADASHSETEPPEPPQTDPPPEASRGEPVEYVSREDKASRLTELKSAQKRTAEEFTGVLPTEVQATFDANAAEIRTLSADIEAADARRAYIETLEGDKDRTDPVYTAPAVIRQKSVEDIYDIERTRSLPTEQRVQALRDNAMRSIEGSRVSKVANVDGLSEFIDAEQFHEDEAHNIHQEATRRVLLTGMPAYRRAFNKYVRDGNDRGFTPEESRAAALAVTGTTTTGGYAVPYVFDPTFIHIGAHTSVNPYRAACRVETISGGNNWVAVTASAITAKWDTEASVSVEGGPTIGQPTFTVQRADAFVTLSIETLQDRPDITAELTSIFGEAKDTLEENSFTLGTGATVYPFGMFRTLAFTAKATATSDVTALTDLTAVEAVLPLRHRMAPGTAWFMSRSTQRQLEALDTTGYYFKRPGQFFAAGSDQPANSPTGNTGTQLLGYPIWEVPSAVSTLTTDAAQIAVFGDPRQYVIVDRIGMNVEVIPLMTNGATPSFPTGQRGVYCYWRATARPINVDGMRQLVVA